MDSHAPSVEKKHLSVVPDASQFDIVLKIAKYINLQIKYINKFFKKVGDWKEHKVIC